MSIGVKTDDYLKKKKFDINFKQILWIFMVCTSAVFLFNFVNV